MEIHEEIEKEIEIMKSEIQSLRSKLAFIKSDRFVFSRLLQLMDGRNLQTGRSTGSKIGLSANEKVSVYGVSPVIQGATINDPSGGATVDTEARNAIDSLINRLQDFGIIQ